EQDAAVRDEAHASLPRPQRQRACHRPRTLRGQPRVRPHRGDEEQARVPQHGDRAQLSLAGYENDSRRGRPARCLVRAPPSCAAAIVSRVFGPGSLTWRVNGEAVLLLGGGRALLLQVAHPKVAAGVGRFSNYREDPWGRLARTLDVTLAIVF